MLTLALSLSSFANALRRIVIADIPTIGGHRATAISEVAPKCADVGALRFVSASSDRPGGNLVKYNGAGGRIHRSSVGHDSSAEYGLHECAGGPPSELRQTKSLCDGRGRRMRGRDLRSRLVEPSLDASSLASIRSCVPLAVFQGCHCAERF